MNHARTTLTALFALAAVSLAPAALAAAPATKSDAPARMERGQHDPAAFAEQRLAKLKADLKITAQQETAWNAYADTVRQGYGQFKSQFDTARKSPAATAPERLDRHIEFMKTRLASMEKTRDAFRTLYDQLTPEQKATADKQAFRMDGHRGPGGKMRHGGDHGPGMMHGQ